MKPHRALLAVPVTVFALCAAACGGSNAPTAAAPASEPPPVPTPTAASSATASYTVDAGWQGTACLLPAAALASLFGPLNPDNSGDGDPAGDSAPGANVLMHIGNDVGGDPYCSEEWVPADNNPGNETWQEQIIVSDGSSWPLKNTLGNYQVHKVPDGLPGEVYGMGESETDASGFYIAAVPLSGDSYVVLGNTMPNTNILTEAQAAAALRVIVPLTIKDPPQGLHVGNLP